MTTLEEAKQFLRENENKGTKCPCCDQFVKVYRRKINSIMAFGLIGLVRKYYETRSPVHVRDISLYGRDVRIMGGSFALLKHWKLSYSAVEEGGKKRMSGYWVPTRMGVSFAKGEISVPTYLKMYNNSVLEQGTDMCYIQDALGVDFDYEELMGNFVE